MTKARRSTTTTPILPMIKFFALLLFSSAFCFAETPPAKLPNEAAILKKNYEAEVQRTIKPLSERYLANLKRLLDQATRAGKLAEAILERVKE